jgi:hypothetical protein
LRSFSASRRRDATDFETADLAKDVNILWCIITETHLNAVHGASDSMRVFDRISLRTKFARLKQRHGVSIGVFKQEHDKLTAPLIGAEDAMEFLSRLDMARYEDMFSFLTNRAHLGEDFPVKPHDAWQVASKWTHSNASGDKMDASGELLSVFNLADDRAPQSGGSGGARISFPAEQLETRTCRGCLKKGHLQRDCPDNRHEKTGVMVAIGEEDEADDDIYDVTLMTTEEHSPADASVSVALLSDTEVLLDNLMGRSMLLTDIRKLKNPICIGGVFGSATLKTSATLASADTPRSRYCRKSRWSTRAVVFHA